MNLFRFIVVVHSPDPQAYDSRLPELGSRGSPKQRVIETKDSQLWDLIHGRSRTDHSAENKEEVGPMQKLSERLNTFADAATLLMIIAFIAFAAWLLAHSG